MDLVSLILRWFPAVFMVGLTFMLYRFPPHASNTTCDHRTRQSTASTAAWNHAQARSFQITRDWTMWMVFGLRWRSGDGKGRAPFSSCQDS